MGVDATTYFLVLLSMDMVGMEWVPVCSYVVAGVSCSLPKDYTLEDYYRC